MRLAFDIRSEFHQLLGHLTREQLRAHWMTVEVQRAYRTLRSAAVRLWNEIDFSKALRGTTRRVVWMCPRIPSSVMRRFSGFVLSCAFVVIGIKMWPKDGETATAAVPSLHQTTSSPQQAGPSGPGLPRNQPRPDGPPLTNSRPAPVDLLAQRKADLVRAQQACMQRLEQTEAYQTAKARFDDIDVRVRALRADDPYRDLPKASVEWIEAKSDLQKIIDEAMKTDPDVVRAQTPLKQPRRYR
jgi:hypothetical protein